MSRPMRIYEAMFQADNVIIRFYREMAPVLAQAQGIPYSEALAQVMAARLEQLGTTPTSSTGWCEQMHGMV
jgi:hypothetical protein